MKVSELMTKNPACATPDMELNKVAKIMAKENIGSVPVVENKDSKKVIGMVTDRDIATRAVAQDKNPLQMTAREVMSKPVFTVNQDDDVREVAKLMQERMVRRVPVVDQNGMVCGMVAQADIALNTGDKTTADVVQKISQPTGKQASR